MNPNANLSYSIAEAKAHLAKLVHQVEEGPAIELTRRGRPVAMLISIPAYERLKGEPQAPFDSVAQVRRAYNFESLDIDPDEVFAAEKDPSPGKDFSW